MGMQHVALPFVYNLNRWRRIEEKKVVFADAHHDKCPEHMELLKKRFMREGFYVDEVYFDVNAPGRWKAFRKMLHFMRLYTQAGVVVICDYFLPVSACRKKKNTTVIQLWHGSGAFKKFGFDSDFDISDDYHGNPHKNYDLVTVSGEACVAPFSTAMGVRQGGSCRVLPLGMSITDKFFDGEYIAGCHDKFKAVYPEAAGKKVVLWAPTFRGNAHTAGLCGESFIDSLISRYNDGGDIFVIKSLHPHITTKEAAAQMSTHELMACADVLITDYSSIFFDYILFDRPIIFFAPDYLEYNRDRGFYLDYEGLPGIIIKEASQELLTRAVLRCSVEDDMSSARAEFRRSYMGGCDGKATERIMDYVKGKLAL